MIKEWILEEKKLLSEGQNGFRKGRSSSDNLLIRKSKTHTIVYFFDVKKAYDRVCRRIVLDNVQRWIF
jgi:hypothetical protein